MDVLTFIKTVKTIKNGVFLACKMKTLINFYHITVCRVHQE